jgi:signal transduction histidine kinase
MRRARWDVVWFVAAVGLLAAGIVGWWQSGPPASPYPFGAGSLMIAVWASGAIILFAWWRRSSAPDASDAPLMGPLALATSGPLSLVSVTQLSSSPSMSAGVLAGLVALPLAWALTGRLVDHAARERARWIAGLSALGAGLLGWRLLGDGTDAWGVARWALMASVALVPAVQLASAILRDQDGRQGSAARRMLASLAVLAMGVAPGVTALCLLVDQWPVLVLPAVAVVVTLIVLTRFALQPLAGLAGAAQSQRDRVVAAADAERMRLASVLHDGPLADITLLIQRLDDRGDMDSAAIARSIAAELRAIGSELRLPVLDDLGTGPALEWLVGRLSSRSGVAIMLDQHTTLRPPGLVELAMYQVAQEALVNALKHGMPPIHVRYRATADGAELLVDDAGPGIGAMAMAGAERDGRLGLPSMAQRAETTGAHLVVATRPEGGTRVAMAWRAPAPASLVDALPVDGSAVGQTPVGVTGA